MVNVDSPEKEIDEYLGCLASEIALWNVVYAGFVDVRSEDPSRPLQSPGEFVRELSRSRADVEDGHARTYRRQIHHVIGGDHLETPEVPLYPSGDQSVTSRFTDCSATREGNDGQQEHRSPRPPGGSGHGEDRSGYRHRLEGAGATGAGGG